MTDTETPPVSRTDGVLSAGTPAEAVPADIVHTAVKAFMPAGAFRTDDHRYYFNGEGPLPSVTTVLEILQKEALNVWKTQDALRALYGLIDLFPADWDEDDALRWAVWSRDQTRNQAANIGSGVHHLADMALRASESDPTGWQTDESTQPYLDAFRAFTDRYSRSSFVSSEKMVWSLNGYAGTYDLLMMIDQELWLWISRPVSGLTTQSTHCSWLHTGGRTDIIIEGNPLKYSMPNVERTGILHLRPEGYTLYEIPTTYESDYLTFLGLLEAYKWKQKERKPVPIST